MLIDNVILCKHVSVLKIMSQVILSYRTMLIQDCILKLCSYLYENVLSWCKIRKCVISIFNSCLKGYEICNNFAK